MLKHAETFLLAVTVLLHSTYASAAVFEMQYSLPHATIPVTRHLQLSDRPGALYHMASFNPGATLQSPLGNLELFKSENLLWAAIGDTRPFGAPLSPEITDKALYLVDAEHLAVKRIGHGTTIRAPAEGKAPEIWAVILIGIGLIWSQLRRKTRHSAIRFTIS